MVWAKKLWDVKSEDGVDGGGKVFSGKDLHMEDIVAEGRFAVIRRGNLSVGNEKTPVAVKVLRSKQANAGQPMRPAAANMPLFELNFIQKCKSILTENPLNI